MKLKSKVMLLTAFLVLAVPLTFIFTGNAIAETAACMTVECHGNSGLVKTINVAGGGTETVPLYVDITAYNATAHGTAGADCTACHTDITGAGPHSVAKTFGGWARFSKNGSDVPEANRESIAAGVNEWTRNYYSTAVAASCPTCHTDQSAGATSAHATIYKLRGARIDQGLTNYAISQGDSGSLSNGSVGENYAAANCNRCHAACQSCHFKSTVSAKNADSVKNHWDEIQATDKYTPSGGSPISVPDSMSEFQMIRTTNIASHEFRNKADLQTDADGVCEACHIGFNRTAKNAYYWKDEAKTIPGVVKASRVKRHPQAAELEISGNKNNISPLTGGTNTAHAAMECADCHGTASTVTGNVHNLPGAAYDWKTTGDVQCTNCHGSYVHVNTTVAAHIDNSGTKVACIGCHTFGLARDFEIANTGSSTSHEVFIDPETQEVRPVVWKNAEAIAWYSHNWQTLDPGIGTCAQKCHYAGNLVGARNFENITSIDGGYVGSVTCGTCHTDKYDDFIQSGHPWKYKHTGGTTPPNAWDPLSSLFPRPKGLDIDTLSLGEDCNDGLVVCDVNGDLDWSAINYTVGGYGWKIRWGVRDTVNPSGTSSKTGYVWTGSSGGATSAQHNIGNGSWSAYNGNTNKKYECATCHNTNGRILTPGYDCAKATTYDAVTNPNVEPWASNTGMNPSDKGGYYSEWSLDGVQCEACHGTGLNHVTNGASKSNIKRNGINCGLCHLRSENTNKSGAVGNAECGGPNVGSDVYKYKVNGAKITGDWIGHHEQYNELAGVNGDGVMASIGCSDCHDPHKRTHKVVDAVATALGITDNNLSAEERGAVVSCESCHSGLKLKYNMGFIKCIDCHMAEATKSATNSSTAGWGRKGDVKTHIFAIDPAATTMDRTNSEGVSVAKNALSVAYACGKCHDGVIGTATTMTLGEAQDAAVDMHLTAPAPVPAKPAITVNISGTSLADVRYILKKNGSTKEVIKNSTGTATFKARKPGAYQVKVYKKGYSFDCNSSGSKVDVTTADSDVTVTCTY